MGAAIFGAVVATFTAVCSIQICMQVWAPEVQPLKIGCAAGTLQLIQAIESARLEAADLPGEQAALNRFRAVVTPAWSMRAALEESCAGDPRAVRHLREVDRLRYAEEHAVRYGAVDLAKRRQEVKRLVPLLRAATQQAP